MHNTNNGTIYEFPRFHAVNVLAVLTGNPNLDLHTIYTLNINIVNDTRLVMTLNET